MVENFDKKEKLKGIIYPVPKNLIDNLFNNGKKVFIKYIVSNSTRLIKRNIVIFYESYGDKRLIGEGTIDNIEFLSPNEVIVKYKDILFINETQFYNYIKKSNKRNEKMLVISLINLIKYKKPIHLKESITMGGKYLTKEGYNKLISSQ
jgi:hypothetical protein